MNEAPSFENVTRPTALRWPQSGTPATLMEDDRRAQMVGDARLLDLALESPGANLLAGILLRCQLATYRRRGHILSYSDEYVWRRLRTARSGCRLPNVYVRCMRCGCAALLLDWCIATHMDTEPLRPPGRRRGRSEQISGEYLGQCGGHELAASALLLTEREEQNTIE